MIYFIDENVEFCNMFEKSLPFEIKSFQNTTQPLLDFFADFPILIISDISIAKKNSNTGMPEGTDGSSILTLFKSLRPGLPVIAISSHSKEEIYNTYEDSEDNLKGVPFFEKPLADDFYDYIEELLIQKNFVFSKNELTQLSKISKNPNKALRFLLYFANDDYIESLLKKSNLSKRKNF